MMNDKQRMIAREMSPLERQLADLERQAAEKRSELDTLQRRYDSEAERPETDDDWVARHGGPGFRGGVRVGGHLAFPDGASCALSGMAIRKEPSADAVQRTRAIREYWWARLELVWGDLAKMHAALTGAYAPFKWPEGTYGPALPTAEEGLDLLRRHVAHARGKFLESHDALAAAIGCAQPLGVLEVKLLRTIDERLLAPGGRGDLARPPGNLSHGTGNALAYS